MNIVAPIESSLDPVDYQKEVDRIVEQCAEQMHQCECPLRHRFSPGIYAREITMPAGAFVIGHKHKTRHLNIVLTGRARVMMNGKIEEIAAPCTFESGEGVQKILLIYEDMKWITIHANPENEQDVVKLEESLVDLSPEFLEAKGNRDLDAFRMSLNENRKEIEV